MLMMIYLNKYNKNNLYKKNNNNSLQYNFISRNQKNYRMRIIN